jgi:hypothetical protein
VGGKRGTPFASRTLIAPSPLGGGSRGQASILGWLAAAAVALLVLPGCCREPRPAPLPEGQQAVRLSVLEGPGGTALALVPVYINDEGPC